MVSKKRVLQVIAIVILVKIVLFSLFFMYSTMDEEKEKSVKTLKVHNVKEITSPKALGMTQEEKKQSTNNKIQWELESKMQTICDAVNLAHDTKFNKTKSLKAIHKVLDTINDKNVFLANYKEKTLYGTNDYEDYNARTIVLEEIQKVRRRKEGFIMSQLDAKGTTRYVYVKNLDIHDFYLGINFIE